MDTGRFINWIKKEYNIFIRNCIQEWESSYEGRKLRCNLPKYNADDFIEKYAVEEWLETTFKETYKDVIEKKTVELLIPNSAESTEK